MRIGKIARLPKTILDQLNLRLANHELGDPLLAWLNGLPEVRRLLAAQFDGVPINKQNLSRWRRGGFREWQSRRDALASLPDLLCEAGELQPSSTEPLADKLAPWVTAHYFLTAKAMLNAPADNAQSKPAHTMVEVQASACLPDNARKFKLLRTLSADLIALRRADHRSMALELKQQRRELCRQRKQPETARTPETPPVPAATIKPSDAPQTVRPATPSNCPQSRPVTPSHAQSNQNLPAKPDKPAVITYSTLELWMPHPPPSANWPPPEARPWRQ